MEMPVQDASPAPTETEPPRSKPHRKGKKIVIFADGTGSAYSAQETNIWRLYSALDKRFKPDGSQQIARYLPGVGTSSNRIIRAIDGATGFGVPANVCKLYRFLCWNWKPGDEIYLFGFSRGAFTVRTLASMVAMQGLMPRRIDGRDIGTSEMKRNAAAAWRAYRRLTAPLVKEGASVWNPRNWQMNPLIEVVRSLRDGVVGLKRWALGQEQHETVLKAVQDRTEGTEPVAPPRSVPVRFMGLFDTVEAYGVPVEQLRRFIDRVIWPIQFRNRRCSAVVQKVRHALSLDDERLTFHPIRFDQSVRDDGTTGPETQELWFAGVHSDVGGGYADNAVSLDPLVWMIDEAELQELEFDGIVTGPYRRGPYPQALIHNSRAGLANIYRYAPRTLQGGKMNGGPPVVHHSALSKMQVGADGYAPLGLPGDFRVYGPGTQRWSGLADNGMSRDIGALEHVRRLTDWRRRTNWMTILCILGLILLPFLQDRLDSPRPIDPALLSRIEWLIGGLLPGWAYSWVVALANWWFLSVPLILAVVAIYYTNQWLADRIKDWAGRIWPTGSGRSSP